MLERKNWYQKENQTPSGKILLCTGILNGALHCCLIIMQKWWNEYIIPPILQMKRLGLIGMSDRSKTHS